MFEVWMDDRVVGAVKAEQEGLYYRFTCTCRPPDDGLYRLWVSDGTVDRDLGICVPEGNVFTLTKSIPAKQLSPGKLSFTLHPSAERAGSNRVRETVRFRDLELLDHARLCDERGMEIIVTEQAPIPPDSDLNP